MAALDQRARFFFGSDDSTRSLREGGADFGFRFGAILPVSALLKALEQLRLWMDPVERTGPAAMAVDEWLLETTTRPLLRVYRWDGNWGSVGYFGRISAARAAFPGLCWVRRSTGGGIVDHREDWTYTVIAPAGCRLAGLRGAESYRVIHAALAEALAAEGVPARLSDGNSATDASSCFENPVGHDLIAGDGTKIAGAGQRRGKGGLLHQGSLAVSCAAGISAERAGHLAGALSEKWEAIGLLPSEDLIAQKIRDRYGCASWTERC